LSSVTKAEGPPHAKKVRVDKWSASSEGEVRTCFVLIPGFGKYGGLHIRRRLRGSIRVFHW